MDESLVCGPVEVRDALVKNILESIDYKKLSEALSIKSKNQRTDAITDLIRSAVLNSPIAYFDGFPHTYVPSFGCYKRIRWADMSDSLYVVMRRIGVPDGDYCRIDLITKIVSRAVSNRIYDVDNSVVVMDNGVFDTVSRRLMPYSSSYMTNKRVEFKYDKDVECFQWKRFLDRVLPDKGMQGLLQEFVAACYIDRNVAKIEHMLILLGEGQNGKSVVFEVLSALLGDENVSHFYISELISGQRREQNIAACKGKRLNYCSEIKTKEIDEDSVDAIKSLISGEPVMGRRLFCEPEIVRTFPLIMANANVLPKIKDPNNSILRRILIIPFSVTIPVKEQNLELPNELKHNLTGIFNWVVEGIERLRRNNYKMIIPDTVRSVVEDYGKDNSSILSWLSERKYSPRITANGARTCQDWCPYRILHDDFISWCNKTGERIITQKDFVRHMKGFGYIEQRRSSCYGFFIFKPNELTDNAVNVKRVYNKTNSSVNEKNARVVVYGISEAEKYLGLPVDSIAEYLYAGKLDGTYVRGKDGISFDISALQSALAECGYFKKINEDGFARRKYIESHQIKGERRMFNTEMRKRGLPFRKYGNDSKNVPIEEKDCIIVPDGWIYTPANATIATKEHNKNIKIYDKNGRELSNG